VNQLRDADTLEMRATWTDSGSSNLAPDSFTDDRMLRVTRDSSGNHQLQLAYPGKAWQEIGSIDGRAALLNDERILVLRRRGLDADLVDTSGRMLRRYEVPFAGKHMSLGLAAVSADGRRFVAYFLGQPNMFSSGRWFAYVWDVADLIPTGFASFRWTPVQAPKFAFCPGGA
jgi:hypothetical protein